MKRSEKLEKALRDLLADVRDLGDPNLSRAIGRARRLLERAARSAVRGPSPGAVAKAKAEIEAEDAETEAYYRSPEVKAIDRENNRRSNLPPEHPEHICGMLCDGQDGSNSHCARLRRKLFGKWH